MASGVRDTDRGARALTRRLRDLDRDGSIKLTVGVHPEQADQLHPSGVPVGEVAMYVEIGAKGEAPVGFIRSTIDQERPQLAQRLADAGARVLEGATLGEGFGPVVRELVQKVKAKVPVDTATVRDSVEGRIDGEKV